MIFICCWLIFHYNFLLVSGDREESNVLVLMQ